MIKIPTKHNLNSYELDVTLEDKGYTLRLDWNTVAKAWTMAIGQADGESILRGVMLVPNVPLTINWHYLPIPPGEFIAYVDDPEAQITRDNFTLYYLTEEEIAQI